ncbi:hypothetical protein GCM10017772_43240 [Promicromonospora soli]|uniref:Uncharacterized protein n=1 Tax=Promicromonospora soli TaxID=2035533 RepID=A0A919KZ70_9MICO|nr:hypothetical protein GCM10017772_43240 [Promicromonospora soli]
MRETAVAQRLGEGEPAQALAAGRDAPNRPDGERRGAQGGHGRGHGHGCRFGLWLGFALRFRFRFRCGGCWGRGLRLRLGWRDRTWVDDRRRRDLADARRW